MWFLKEFWDYIKVRKKWWLVPIIIILAIFSSLVIVSEGTVIGPFIYTVF